MGSTTPTRRSPRTNDPRWAFGTGFADPLAGVDTTVPAGVDGDDLAAYCLMLGDDALVLSTASSSGARTTLEDEVALANIALDLLGQARLLLTRAGAADGSGRGEDAYAYFRDEAEFRNVCLVELRQRRLRRVRSPACSCSPRGGWPCSSASPHRPIPVLAAIAAKGVKEVAYHRDYAAQWAVRLGDGTDESHGGWTAARRAVAAHGRAVRRHAMSSSASQRGAAVDPGDLAGEFPARDRPCCAAHRPLPGRVGPGGRRPESAYTPRRCDLCSPSCRSCPRRSGGDVVTARADHARRSPPPSPTRSCRLYPRRPRRAAATSRSTRAPWSSPMTPTYSGCPAMDVMRDDVVARCAAPATTKLRSACGLTPAWTRTGSAPRGGASSPPPGSPAGTPSGPAGRPIPITLRPSARRCACPRADPTTPTRRRPSGPRLASRCTAAGRAASRSSTSRSCDRGVTRRGSVPSARRRRRRPAVRRRRGDHLRRPGRARRRLRLPPRASRSPCAASSTASSAPLVLDLRAGRGAAADRRARGSRRGGVVVAGARRAARRPHRGAAAERHVHAGRRSGGAPRAHRRRLRDHPGAVDRLVGARQPRIAGSRCCTATGARTR